MNQQTSIYQTTDLNEEVMSGKGEKNAKITNPNTGNLSFGKVPENGNGIPSGEIYLKLGLIGRGGFKRYGAFGARHIWEKHKADLNIQDSKETAVVIAEILSEGVDVVVNFNAPHTPRRPIILNTQKGRVALELEVKGGVSSYSIVSAYGNKNAPGTVIGKLEGPTD